jgi:hypothetical protein
MPSMQNVCAAIDVADGAAETVISFVLEIEPPGYDAMTVTV